MNRKNLEEKFKKAHLEYEELQELVDISDDLDIDDTLNLLLDSELLSSENTAFFKLNRELEGEITLGIEPRDSRKVSLDQGQLAHSLILGKTQYGKSTLLAILITQLLDLGITHWVFEPKQDHRHLIRDHPELKVVRLDQLKLNPFIPPLPSLPLRRWWQIVWEILTQEQELLSGSKAMGYELLARLLDTTGLGGNDLKSSQGFQIDKIPTMEDFTLLVDRVLTTEEQRGGPRRQYLERLKTRLTSLLFSFKDTFNCKVGWPLEDLKDTSIVFEYEGIDTSAARFVILVLLYKLFYYHQLMGERTKDVYRYLIFDEAERVFSPYLEGKATGNPFLNELVNWSKEFGLGFIVANQTPKLTSSIKDNATTRIVFNMDGEYIPEISSQLGLDEEQESAMMELDVGSAVVRTSGVFTKPFLVNVPHFKLEKDVTDKEVSENSQSFIDKLMAKVKPAGEKLEVDREKAEEKEKEVEIDFDFQALLQNIAQFPFISLKERRKKLGWGSNKLNRISEDLRNQGLIRKKRLNKGGRGGSITLLELTDRAISYLKNQGVKPKQGRGRGGINHTYWVNKLSNHYKGQGYDVREEVKLKGVIADLVTVDKKGKVTAVEVEVTKPKDTLAKLDNLLSQVDELLIVADKRTLLNELEGKVGSKKRVRVKKAQDMNL